MAWCVLVRGVALALTLRLHLSLYIYLRRPSTDKLRLIIIARSTAQSAGESSPIKLELIAYVEHSLMNEQLHTQLKTR